MLQRRADQLRRAEHTILLLRMLQDQHGDFVVHHRRDIDCGAVNVTVLTIDSPKPPPEADGAVIGDGWSTLQDGTISAVNRPAYRLGCACGRGSACFAATGSGKIFPKVRETFHAWPSST